MECGFKVSVHVTAATEAYWFATWAYRAPTAWIDDCDRARLMTAPIRSSP